MSCGSTNQNHKHLLKDTKFTEKQIKTIYVFFKSFATNKDKSMELDLEEAKNCFGLIGKENSFFGNRLVKLVNNRKDLKVVSFYNYVKFLDCINNGSPEEKLDLRFNFFDIKSNGVIKKQQFCEVMHEINKFLATITNCKLNTSYDEISNIFDSIIEKVSPENKRQDFLTKQNFTKVMNSQMEEIDIYNIFNNSFKNDNVVKLKKNKLEDINYADKLLSEIVAKLFIINFWSVLL